MSSMRTFIAVELSPHVIQRAQEVIARLRTSGAKVSWVHGGNMHMTLSFLGDVDERMINDVCVAVGEAVKNIEPFDFEATGVGAFPKIESPRTIWLSVERGQEELCQLQQAIEQSLTTLGFPSENRRFRPHLTLGRVRQSGPTPELLAEKIRADANLNAGETIVDEVVVFSSRLTKDGPVYEALARAELGTNR